jgi:3-oxoacyl-[acyl-carrier protein] reductase
MQIDLPGRVALVTGATGDLGQVIAKHLARCGADVALHYHSNSAKAEELQREIEALGRRAVCVSGDVGKKDDVLKMRDAIEASFGAPHIVVANAVVQYEWTTVLQQPSEDYESQFRSCVLQVVNLAQAFVPAMQERGAGRFIAINTECSLQCHPNQSAYVSGKRGMDGVLRVLAREVGPQGITVNQVAPGWMISERDRTNHSEAQPEYEANVPLRHRGEDQEIANAVAFFASDLAGFITGSFLPVCGGNVMTAI